MKGSRRERRCRGFTLIELVVTILIVAIVAAVGVSRILSVNTVELSSQIDKIKSHLRYAQMKSMNDNLIWGVNFSGTEYSLFRNGDITDTIKLPGEDSITVSLPSGDNSTVTVAFDTWGRPSEDASSSPPAAVDISLKIGGKSGAITVYKNTGYVP
jgi:prepilin-type N-terminal cleavage/methylation domain-containing protein